MRIVYCRQLLSLRMNNLNKGWRGVSLTHHFVVPPSPSGRGDGGEGRLVRESLKKSRRLAAASLRYPH